MIHASTVFARLLSACLVLIGLVSCGSGGVSNPAPVVTDPNRITILPATAFLYSGQPTTFSITGGTGTYLVSSSDQSVIPSPVGFITANTLTVIPAAVPAESPVTLTVRDTGTTTPASATLTVRPRIVESVVTITPSSTQGGGCAPAVCSGGDAEVVATFSQNGAPLAGREARFVVSSGDFGFVVGSTVANTATVTTDSAGKARIRVRAGATAGNQTAILQVQDVASGSFQTASFTIAQATGTSPGFFATPPSMTFAGPNTQTCANSGSAEVYIFGGQPPYSIFNPGAGFTVNTIFVPTSGGSFRLSPTGQCATTIPITISDSAGRTTTVTASSVVGTQAPPPLRVAPSAVSLSECTSTADVAAVGGQGPGSYNAVSGNSAVMATAVSPNTIRISRNPSSRSPATVDVAVFSGNETATVTVTVSPATCP